MIIDYCILYAKKTDDLVLQVKAHLLDGWEPQGGPYMDGLYSEDSCPYECQAMIKRGPDK